MVGRGMAIDRSPRRFGHDEVTVSGQELALQRSRDAAPAVPGKACE